MKKKIIITGANGFIGRYFIENFKEAESIIGITRKINKNDPKKNMFLEIDLTQDNFTKNLPKNCETIIHMAQSSQYRNFPFGAEDMRKINIDSTCKLLDWSIKNNIKNFIFLSTANVYETSPIKYKECSDLKPNSFYGLTKLCAENLALQYSKYLNIKILRLFTVYGPKQKRMLIPNMIENIKNGKEITLANGKGPKFSPIFVNDVFKIINHILKLDDSILCNVCGDEVFNLKQIIDIISENLKIEANIKKNSTEEFNFSGNNHKLHCLIPELKLESFSKSIKKVL